MRLLTIISLALLMFPSHPQLAIGADPMPCSCLQELWVDDPGPYDLYIAISHQTSCYDGGEETLWQGWPSNPTLPQECGATACEEYQGPGGRAAAAFPGHGQELVGARAWDAFRVGLESARRKTPGLEFGTPSYYVIPRKNLPVTLKETRDIIVMAIPMNTHNRNSRFDGNTYFLCIQIDSADGLPLSKATFEDVTPGRGSQLSVKFRLKTGEVRKGLVWLK